MPLYKRSSFLTLLRTKYDCKLTPLKDRNTIKVENGPAVAYIFVTKLDRIDYDEIYLFYQKLALPELPSPLELELAE
jgi:hypothetical protein